jgi:hypothetical protein
MGSKNNVSIGELVSKLADAKNNLNVFSGLNVDAKIVGLAIINDLSFEEMKIFHKFISKRFPTENDTYYLDEWAKRFKNKSAYAHADIESTKILTKLGLVE